MMSLRDPLVLMILQHSLPISKASDESAFSNIGHASYHR